jgi:hypothetical protein
MRNEGEPEGKAAGSPILHSRYWEAKRDWGLPRQPPFFAQLGGGGGMEEQKVKEWKNLDFWGLKEQT